jgi:transmembrane sensor
VLRSRGHYEAAVQALTSALAEDLRAPTRERLSFELGAILSRRLADPARACAHWSRHRTQFPSGRYDEEILQTHVQLGCPSP